MTDVPGGAGGAWARPRANPPGRAWWRRAPDARGPSHRYGVISFAAAFGAASTARSSRRYLVSGIAVL